MPSPLVKILLTVTAVSPALGAAAIIAWYAHGSAEWAWRFGIAALLAMLVSLLVLLFVRQRVQREPLNVTEIRAADEKTLEFLLAYLLPTFSGVSLAKLESSVALTLYSLVIVLLVVGHGKIFQFNPVLALFGYHFYVVKANDVDYLLVSRKSYHRAQANLTVKKIADYMYLDVPS